MEGEAELDTPYDESDIVRGGSELWHLFRLKVGGESETKVDGGPTRWSKLEQKKDLPLELDGRLQCFHLRFLALMFSRIKSIVVRFKCKL